MGHVIEVYTFQRMPLYAGAAKKHDDNAELDWVEDIGDIGDSKGDYKKHNSRRARWNLMRLVNMNFDSHSKFVTLTFADNVVSLDEAHKEFDRFMKRMKRRYPKFKYVVATEFQKRGAVHYHMIADLPYVRNDELRKLWRNGFVRINDIENCDNVGAYTSKYISKQNKDVRLNGRKAYMTSKNLDRPIILKGDDALAVIEYYGLEQKKEVFTSSYTSEHHGKIVYHQYNMRRS